MDFQIEINTIYRGKSENILIKPLLKRKSFDAAIRRLHNGSNEMNGCIDVRRDERRGQTGERTGEAHST